MISTRHLHMRAIFVLVVGTAAALYPGVAHPQPQTIHDNLGPDDAAHFNGGEVFGSRVAAGHLLNVEAAQAFIVPHYTSYSLESVQIGLKRSFGSIGDRFRLALHADEEEKPGELLGEYWIEEPVASYSGAHSVHRTAIEAHLLAPGERYWVVATAAEPGMIDRDARFIWLANVTGDETPRMNRSEGGTWRITQLDSLTLRVIASPNVIGDFNGNEALDAGDIDILSAQIRTGSEIPIFDVNSDGSVNDLDRIFWVRDLRNICFGDANLNGEFNSADLVRIFAAGEYEDDISLNSTWATGDWNGDGDLTSSDIMLAFQDGGYEQGPRPALATVPEPNGIGMMTIALVLAAVSSSRWSRQRF